METIKFNLRDGSLKLNLLSPSVKLNLRDGDLNSI